MKAALPSPNNYNGKGMRGYVCNVRVDTNLQSMVGFTDIAREHEETYEGSMDRSSIAGGLFVCSTADSRVRAWF